MNQMTIYHLVLDYYYTTLERTELNGINDRLTKELELLQNYVTEKCGVSLSIRNKTNIFEYWQVFCTKSMIDSIVNNTNIYISKMLQNYSQECDASDTNYIENINAQVCISRKIKNKMYLLVFNF